MASLYAITADPERFRFYLECGIPYVQFRNKKTLPPSFDDIRTVSKVIINDSVEQCEEYGAWGVHLGQEDLDRYPAQRLLSRRFGLGISTHSDKEVERALTLAPDYIAFGPIYPTTAKPMAYGPQGLERLKALVAKVHIPVIAIGGINSDLLQDVLATGVSGVAMISGLAEKTKREIETLISLCETHSE